jgi:hypothetical protein
MSNTAAPARKFRAASSTAWRIYSKPEQVGGMFVGAGMNFFLGRSCPT